MYYPAVIHVCETKLQNIFIVDYAIFYSTNVASGNERVYLPYTKGQGPISLRILKVGLSSLSLISIRKVNL